MDGIEIGGRYKGWERGLGLGWEDQAGKGIGEESEAETGEGLGKDQRRVRG